jgi:hypothetical protein
MSPSAWKRQLGEWREWLRTREGPSKVDQVEQERAALVKRIQDIRDPNALSALQTVVSQGTDRQRIHFLEPLARIGGPAALDTLARVSVNDADEELRKRAAQLIGTMPNGKDALPFYTRCLHSAKARDAAGAALSLSGLSRRAPAGQADPELVYALINALVRRRTTVVPQPARLVPRYGTWGGGSTLRRMIVDPGVLPEGFSNPQGGGPTLVFPEYYPAPMVLKALVEYTGQNFGYNQIAWRQWAKGVERPKPEVPGRRAPGGQW